VGSPTIVADATRRTPLTPPRAHNGWFKDEDGKMVPSLVPRLSVAPDAIGTKRRRAKNTPTAHQGPRDHHFLGDVFYDHSKMPPK
jgi:hypothetical protein